ncbi:MAG: AAA family ATPase [Actinomycetia bacterium]|nr:AAA family ATPase [Actinomycetes bacterium]
MTTPQRTVVPLRGQGSVPPRATEAIPFVGRTVERAQLAASLEQVANGDPIFVAVTGESGIGKTRLLQEALELAGRPAHWARASSDGTDPPYWTLTQILRSLRVRLGHDAYVESVGEGASNLLEPSWVPGGEATIAAGGLTRFRLFDRMMQAMKALSRVEPLILVIDDVQWADLSTLSFLTFLAQSATEDSIALFVTIRDHETTAPSGPLQDLMNHTTVIRMNRLNRRHTRVMLEHTSEQAVGDGYVDSAFEATAGNPHYLVEYARVMPTNTTGVEYRLADTKSLRMDRASRLDSPTRRLVDAAAVLGEAFDVDLLAAVADVPASVIVSTLTEQATYGLIAPRGQNRFGFVHGLNREAIYAALEPNERARLHHSAAHCLELLYSQDLQARSAEVAYHLGNADVVTGDRSVLDRLVVAARTANEAFAREEAVRRYGHAIDEVDRLGTDGATDLVGLRITLGIEQGVAAMTIAQPDEARAILRDAAGLARAANDTESLAKIALAFPPGLEGVAIAPAADEEQVALREEALNALDSTDSPLRAELMAALAACRYWTSHLSEKPEMFPESLARQDRQSGAALAMARRLDNKRTLARCVLARLHAVWTPDYRGERPGLVAELLEVAEDLGDLDLLAAAVGWQILAAFDEGRIRDATQLIRTYAELADRLCQPLYRRNAHQWAACARVLRGDIEGGVQAMFGAMATTAALIGDENAVSEASMLVSVQRYFTGDFAPLIEPARHIFASNRRTSVNWQAGLLFMLAEIGELDESRTYFDALMGEDHSTLPRDINWLVSSQLLALTAVRLGDRDRAQVLYEALLPFEGVDVTHGWGYASYGAVGWSLGELSVLLDRPEVAAEHLRRVVETRETGPFRSVAELRLSRIRMDLDPSATAEVLDGVDRLAAQFRAWGALRFAAEADELLASHRLAARSVGNVVSASGSRWRFTSDLFTDGVVVSGRGVHYLVELLSRPGEPIPSLDLLRLATGGAGGSTAVSAVGEMPHSPGRLGEVIDATARRAYERRLAELERSKKRALRRREAVRASACDVEIDQIRRELADSTNPAGRTRLHNDDHERARVSVTKAIRRAIQALYDEAPKLAAHLDDTITTGLQCSYGPHPDVLEWVVVTA